MAARESAAEARASGRQDPEPDPSRDARRGRVLSAPLVYVDASAVAKIVLAEAGSAELQRFLEADLELVSNVILRVELLRALRRAEVGKSLVSKAHRTLERFNLRRASDEILARAAELPPRSLRTIDAIHLATALDLSPPPAVFLCYDRRLAEAARHHGLAVVSPGADEVHEP